MTRSEVFAAAVVRCYDLFIERRTEGSRILYDAVNEMFSYLLTDDYYRSRKC